MFYATLPNANEQILEVQLDNGKMWSRMVFCDSPDDDAGGYFGCVNTYYHVDKSDPMNTRNVRITKARLRELIPNSTLHEVEDYMGTPKNGKPAPRVRYTITCDSETYILSGVYFARSHSDDVPAKWRG